MSVNTYDPGRVLVDFLGQRITGFADGTFVMVERITDVFTSVAGADGEVGRVRSRDKRGKITITLAQFSDSNPILSAALAADELLGTGVGPVFIKDLEGNSIAQASNAWIVKPASMEFGKDMADREWVLECDDLTIFVGNL